MATPAEQLAQAVEATNTAEVIRAALEGDSVKLIFRVHKKKQWLDIVEFVLARKSKWTEHVCQQYFLREGRLVYCWNFILRPTAKLEEAVAEAVKLLTQAITTVPRAAQQHPVDEFPLVGASARRTSRIMFDPRAPGPSRGGPSHKGAYTIAGE
jgi:hypothetical protein